MNNITSVEFITPDVDPQGTQIKIKFANGWGASLIKHRYSYGYKEGQWELAVLKNNDINYANPLTNDVIGNLNDVELNQHLTTIASW